MIGEESGQSLDTGVEHTLSATVEKQWLYYKELA